VNRSQHAESDVGCAHSAWNGEEELASASLPETGRGWSDIRAELVARKVDDYDWRSGRVSLYVYHDDDELLEVSREAYGLYFSENALGQRAFPSLARMESELVRMSLALFNAPAGADGSFTSGGTESILLAMKAARDYFRATTSRDFTPNVVIPCTAHPAFDKAAHLLGVHVRRVPTALDFRVDVARLRAAIDARTMLIAGSAPCYPYGVFDSIRELAELAQAKDLWLHVDACLGGFLAPFAREEGHTIPAFDFSIPGVTSLSADLHKYGFSARGASVVLYRRAQLKEYQVFRYDTWPRGSYATDTMLGSRPGGSISSAWAVSQYLGRSGYRRLARKTMDAKHRLVRGIESIPGLRVLRPTELSIVLYQSIDAAVDIDAVAEVLGQKGWFVGRSREPRAIHVALNAVHAPAMDRYLEDLADSVLQVRCSGRVGTWNDSTY
jgi:sphinganine-1-phosphate aldolase